MPSLPERAAGATGLRASILGAFLEGWRRVLHAPALTAGLVALTFLTALPLTVVLGGMLERHLGSSLEAERALTEWNATWASEFSTQTPLVGRVFTHEILGFGGTLAALSRLVDAEPLDPALATVVIAYIALWVFLSGGILDRLARGRAIGLSAFFSACGVYVVRFLRLAVVVGVAYWVLFAWLHPILFSTFYDYWTRNLTTEHQVLAIRVALYAVFLAGVMMVSLVADFAKVRAVVEDRRSMIGALGAATRFVRRRWWRVAGLYLLNIVAGLVILRLWLQTAPGAAVPTWLALLGGQLYLLGRIWAKLAFMASEVVFFQGELAHATYTALPEPVWPDSPAVEAIRNVRN
jgi:hypothetical protein